MTPQEIRNAIEVMKEETRLCFCYYDFQVDKRKWKHPDNTCLPSVIERVIDKFVQSLGEQNGD